jgi:hypothetical protein
MIKSLTHYMRENKETYDFRIKIACIEITPDVMDKIEHSLESFDVASISKAKSLPIQNNSLDFPSFGACEISLIMASLNYPCTDEQVRQALSTHGRIPAANIVVTPKDQPEELMREESAQDEESNKKYEPLLTKDIESISGGQPKVGQQRVDSLLKELESRKTEFASKDIAKKAETTNDIKQSTTSPYKTKVVKIKE